MGLDDAIRLYARDVGVDPEIKGARTVQDCLNLGGGPLALGNNTTDRVRQTTATSLTADGQQHAVTCVIASPPAWMDNAGNITETGLYWVSTVVTGVGGATTPGQYVQVGSPFYDVYFVPCDATGGLGGEGLTDVQALATADLPFAVTAQVVMPTDATYTATAQIFVARLAW